MARGVPALTAPPRPAASSAVTMKCVAALALLAASAHAASYSEELVEWALREHFSLFESKFAKAYATREERESRFVTFVENLEQVISKNAALREAGADEVHGVTQFSDWSKDEFAARMLNPMIGQEKWPDMPVAVPKNITVPNSLDWRDSGAVTPVKNQQMCGSCWAHSAVESVESQYAIKGGELTALSVQQVVSCDADNGDMGCEGGWYYTAWMDYIAKNGGLTTEANYPYDTATSVGRASDCDSTKEKAVTSGTTPTKDALATPGCTGFFCNSQDEDTLKNNLVSYGPISIACDASEWSSYSGGVMTSSSCSSSGLRLDHAIQVVGYNEDASTPYWIVRNSWDTTWGEDGYIYLKMGDNTCGIADAAWMVTL